MDPGCIMEKKLKKPGRNKNKLITIYPKNPENFKNSKPRGAVPIKRVLKKECMPIKVIT